MNPIRVFSPGYQDPSNHWLDITPTLQKFNVQRFKIRQHVEESLTEYLPRRWEIDQVSLVVCTTQ